MAEIGANAHECLFFRTTPIGFRQVVQHAVLHAVE